MEFYYWIIIILLIAIVSALNRNYMQQLSKKEKEKLQEKQKADTKKVMKVTWWILGIILFITIIFILWALSQPAYTPESPITTNNPTGDYNLCMSNCITVFINCAEIYQPNINICTTQQDNCERNC